MPVENITSEEHMNEVLKAHHRVIVDFGADWCGPCKMVKPTFLQLSDQHHEVKCVYVDVDNMEEIPQIYNVSGLPTFILFSEGKEVKRISGDKVDPLKALFGTQ